MFGTLYAPVVAGKPEDWLIPLTTTWPAAVTATASATLAAEPPSRSENTILPEESSLVTNERPPALPVGNAPKLPPAVTGKSGDKVEPATYALPAPSTVIAFA